MRDEGPPALPVRGERRADGPSPPGAMWGGGGSRKRRRRDDFYTRKAMRLHARSVLLNLVLFIYLFFLRRGRGVVAMD